MKSPGALEDLVEALRCLPGVGPKSAQRIAYQLLQHDKPGALQIARALDHAVQSIRHCALCNTLTEPDVCVTCANPQLVARRSLLLTASPNFFQCAS